MTSLFPNTDIQRYIIKLLATFIYINDFEQKFYRRGRRSNGKNKPMDFLKTFGSYLCRFPVSLITKNRTTSIAITSIMDQTRGKHIVVIHEPEHESKINIGIMKELMGGDFMYTRSLY